MRSYVLENEDEFERLERQSKNESYDYKSELVDFSPKQNGSILDAGCGSGVVSRHLATLYPQANITACDFSELRIAQAKAHSESLPNLHYEIQNLTQATFKERSFDAIICRYVLEHLNQTDVKKAVAELFRGMRPNGMIHAIDMDGFLFNLHPQTPLLQKVFAKLATEMPLDLFVGRKIPALLQEAGFRNIRWRIETVSFQNENLTSEIALTQERFESALPFFIQFLGEEAIAHQFVKEYLECLHSSEIVLFYNKFVVSAQKPGLQEVSGQ
jgi:ubiquinone/menaquinone biosynthesis C-methylase UbiE